MKTRNLISVVLMTVALVSCRDRETSLTGAYGSAVVAGRVIMGGELAGGSPAGVQVSVAGTGMMTTLGDDGRFSFVGVPRDAELRFFRADGIESTMRTAASNALVVELDNKSASKARRRGAAPKLEYEGLIREIAADKVVLYTSHKQLVEIGIDGETVIRKGGTPMTPAELLVDWRVHVEATTKDGKIVATQIVVQNTGEDDEEDGANTMNANGAVISIDPLTVKTNAHGDVVVQTNEATIVKKQGERITVDQIEVGWEINAHGTRVDDHTMLAREIEVRGKSKKP